MLKNQGLFEGFFDQMCKPRANLFTTLISFPVFKNKNGN